MGKRERIKRIIATAMVMMAVIAIFPVQSRAVSSVAEENRYYLGKTVNAGKDTGYAESNHIGEDDPHFGWDLGSFYVSGYTRVTATDSESPVFLKNVGDRVTLWFSMEQDIDNLNGTEKYYISEDTNGHDDYFGVEKTNFGRGTLIIRHTDYQNKAGKPTIYTDYLAANLSTDADVQVELFEEGDYEVALNYEVKQVNLDLFGWQPLPTYYNYRIFFRFSVRNGNCMVFPFDVTTGEELTNTAITENGFYLNLAKSRYLDIDIKKEVLREGANGLTEDTRFNRPAKDGEAYTDEGIYTITVTNNYTHQTTTKVIYVGTNNVLKAYVTTGLTIPEIEAQLLAGATIADDGTIIPPTPIETTLPPSVETTEPTESSPRPEVDDQESQPVSEASGSKTDDASTAPPYAIIVGIGLICFGTIIMFICNKKEKNESSAPEESAEDEENAR